MGIWTSVHDDFEDSGIFENPYMGFLKIPTFYWDCFIKKGITDHNIQIIDVILVFNISLSFFQNRNWSLKIDLYDHNLDEGDNEASTAISPYTRFEVEHKSYN